MIWQYFYKELLSIKKDGMEAYLSEGGGLIPEGGWKWLANEAVS